MAGSLWVHCSAGQRKRREKHEYIKVEEETLGTTGDIRARKAGTKGGGGVANILQRRKLKPRGLIPHAAYLEGRATAQCCGDGGGQLVKQRGWSGARFGLSSYAEAFTSLATRSQRWLISSWGDGSRFAS